MGFPSPAESEREEGEIIEVIETLAESLIPDHQIIEYEEISSDEEFNLRQRIGELEARNQELEKIASISSTKASDYGKFKGCYACRTPLSSCNKSNGHENSIYDSTIQFV